MKKAENIRKTKECPLPLFFFAIFYFYSLVDPFAIARFFREQELHRKLANSLVDIIMTRAR